MSTSTSLREEVTAFHSDLEALLPRIDDLAVRINDAATAHIDETGAANSQALLYVENLLEFVRTTTPPRAPDASPSPRVLGELHSLVAHLYGRFAVAKGVASDTARSCAELSQPIREFSTTEFAPLVTRSKELTTRVTAANDEAAAAAAATKTEHQAAQAEMDAKHDAITSTERQLKELHTNLTELRAQITGLEAEKTALERKASAAKERQRQQGVSFFAPSSGKDRGCLLALQATAAAGFFSMFAPVFAPLAMSGGKIAMIAYDQIRTVDEKLANLRQQCDGSNPAVLEFSLGELRSDHERLAARAQAVASTLFELENERLFAENTVYLLSAAAALLEQYTARVGGIEEGVKEATRGLEVEAAHAEAAAGGLVFLMHGLFTQELGYGGVAREVLESLKTLLDIVAGPERYRDVVEACRKIFEELTAADEDRDVVDVAKEMEKEIEV
ncbi:hypothetical protein EDC01DRAFT_753926 [Geopyxis carbonaria]|nr:hypothetical protein EDC01DRAFT_753926 [Geopyxis carbonaria]